MLSLDTENSVLNPAAVRAIKNTRLGQLKKIFGTYFGFTTATEVANFFALSQVIGDRAAAETGTTNAGSRIPGTSESVIAARNDLTARVDPSLAPIFSIFLDTGGGATKILLNRENPNDALVNQLAR